jgi:hypothetical protein
VANKYTGSDVGQTGIVVTEVDGTPFVAGVTKLILSNNTIQDNGNGVVTVNTGGGGAGGVSWGGTAFVGGVATFANVTTANSTDLAYIYDVDTPPYNKGITVPNIRRNVTTINRNIGVDNIAGGGGGGTPATPIPSAFSIIEVIDGGTGLDVEVNIAPSGSGLIMTILGSSSIGFTAVGGISGVGNDLVFDSPIGSALTIYDSPSQGRWFVLEASGGFGIV